MITSKHSQGCVGQGLHSTQTPSSDISQEACGKSLARNLPFAPLLTSYSTCHPMKARIHKNKTHINQNKNRQCLENKFLVHVHVIRYSSKFSWYNNSVNFVINLLFTKFFTKILCVWAYVHVWVYIREIFLVNSYIVSFSAEEI